MKERDSSSPTAHQNDIYLYCDTVSTAGIQRTIDWMPDQVRHDKKTSPPRCLLRYGLFELPFKIKKSLLQFLQFLLHAFNFFFKRSDSFASRH